MSQPQPQENRASLLSFAPSNEQKQVSTARPFAIISKRPNLPAQFLRPPLLIITLLGAADTEAGYSVL